MDEAGLMVSQDALEYLNGIEAEKAAVLAQEQRMVYARELLDHCNSWFQKSAQWRKQSYEEKWNSYQRMSDAVYDPNLSKHKEGWQSKAFVPIVPSHRENIKAALFRTLLGARPFLEMRARTEIENDQSENIKDLILREAERTRLEVECDKVLDDATIFGSGFCRIRHEVKTEDRLVRRPMMAQIDPMNPQDIYAAYSGNQQVMGYTSGIEPVVIYRGIKLEYLPIWDVFPDPQALQIKGSGIIYRYKTTYGEIVKGAQEGYYLPEAVEKLRDMPGDEKEPEDKDLSRADRDIAESSMTRPDYAKLLTCYEFFCRLPKKWVLINDEEIDDPEKLVPARIIFHSECVLAVEPSGEYDGEPPIYKLDYLGVAGQFYARGIPEMLKDIQDVVNETVNQRIDNVSLVINRMFGVIDKALVNRADLVSKPGGFIRIDAKFAQDIRQALMPMEIPDVTRSAYLEATEMERYAQERTSANRVTLGTAGMVNDSNQTLGGQQLLKQSASEKFAYIGMVMEFTFLQDVARAFWRGIYANLEPEDVVKALGPKRAQTFELLSPEQIDQDYIYEPQGIFTMENKTLLQARLAAQYQMFANQPWLNPMAYHDKMAKTSNLDPDSLKYTPEEMVQNMIAQANMAAASQPVPEQRPAPAKKEAPVQ